MKQMTVTLSVPDVMKEMKASIADNFMKPCWIIGSYTEPLGRSGHNATVGGVEALALDAGDLKATLTVVDEWAVKINDGSAVVEPRYAMQAIGQAISGAKLVEVRLVSKPQIQVKEEAHAEPTPV